MHSQILLDCAEESNNTAVKKIIHHTLARKMYTQVHKFYTGNYYHYLYHSYTWNVNPTEDLKTDYIPQRVSVGGTNSQEDIVNN